MKLNQEEEETRWFEELTYLNHLAFFISEFLQKLLEKLSKKIHQLSLVVMAARNLGKNGRGKWPGKRLKEKIEKIKI